MKKLIILSSILLLALVFSATPALAGGGGGGINNPPGNPLYVIIEVNWDGTDDYGDWTVWGPAWAPEVGTGVVLASCTDCLDMSSYQFTFRGKTVHFDEIYVSGVDASPQVHHVVLKDADGDGTYTGSLAAAKYIWADAEPSSNLYHDRIDYEITFDQEGNLVDFHYLQYEHKKIKS